MPQTYYAHVQHNTYTMTHKLTHTYTKLSINYIHTETTTDRKNETIHTQYVPTQAQTHFNIHTL